ncbi:hypothetical protein QYE76_047020 [Lolium multiflorum]|uniref:Aminotransferase-like plant mobile domain-containing protein n=1 Tax=Lolium multiflorum TaxID=4521 RepID=A0AAD8TQX8_LOLMU|nr:hypothetical protein QYE76_047020 [Lolium multiflorum]
MCAAHKHRCRCRGDPVDRIVAIDGPARTLVALESLTLFIPAGGTPAVGEDLSRFRAEWVAAVDVRSPGQVRSPAGRTKARVSRLAARADALLWFWATDPCLLCSAFHQIAHGEACRSEENAGCSLPDQQASVLKPWAVVARGWFRVELPSPVRQVLEPLKIRYHGSIKNMSYDERYTKFIQPTGLLPFIALVSRGPPNMNAAALTALVDRWRSETHTFHLRAGDMTPTLQDVSMILGLPIKGKALCMNTTFDGWRQQMDGLIGMAPPEPENKKDRAPAGANFLWIRTNFGQCPEGADRDTVKTYT